MICIVVTGATYSGVILLLLLPPTPCHALLIHPPPPQWSTLLVTTAQTNGHIKSAPGFSALLGQVIGTLLLLLPG